jgi:hypothetical protein
LQQETFSDTIRFLNITSCHRNFAYQPFSPNYPDSPDSPSASGIRWIVSNHGFREQFPCCLQCRIQSLLSTEPFQISPNHPDDANTNMGGLFFINAF